MCRNDLLEGLLGANLVGFHTNEYCNNFLKSVNNTLNFDSKMGWISTPSNDVNIQNYAMGIDVKYFENNVKSEKVIQEKVNLLKNFKNVKIILSIDRLDYTKGIINRLKAYQIFLQNNKQWHQKVVLMLSVAPSREKVCHYHETQKKIEEII
jgi:trehalose 6-phosphate synthase/phosphatase